MDSRERYMAITILDKGISVSALIRYVPKGPSSFTIVRASINLSFKPGHPDIQIKLKQTEDFFERGDSLFRVEPGMLDNSYIRFL